MKIYSIIRSIKAEKNATNQRKGPASNIATVIAAISAAVAAALWKIDISPPGILPQPWLIGFYHHDHYSHWFGAKTILQSFIPPAPRTGSPPAPSHSSPTLPFAEFHFWGLFIDSKGKGTAGWPLTCPGEPQEDLWRGQQKYHRRNIRRRVPQLVWAARKVRVYRRWPCQEKLRKKVCSIMFTSCFINTFRVDFSHTS